MIKKNKPHYDLKAAKALARAGKYSITLTARNDGAALGIDKGYMVAVVLGLIKKDFYKSMPSKLKPGEWQDVYRPRFANLRLYVKIRVTHELVIISFKEL